MSNLASDRPDIPKEEIVRIQELIDKAVPDCLVTGYRPIIKGLDLPDPKHNHVLAAAMKMERR
jgi:hypothetical protein